MSQEVDEIKSKLNIVDVIGDYIQLKKVGANFRARCPFHNEKTPSFYVSAPRQIWHCFGCSLGGDVFEFIKQIESVDFPQALELLAGRAGVQLRPRQYEAGAKPAENKKVLYELNALAARFYNKTLLASSAAAEAREYLEKRKFSADTVASWMVGYAPNLNDALYQFLKKKGYADGDIQSAGLALRGDRGGWFDRFRDRVMFPILDIGGRTVGFSARILHPKEGVGKYINSPDSSIYNKSRVIFGLYQSRAEIRKKNMAVIVEGNVDVIKSHQAGATNAVGSSGTAFTSDQLQLLSRLCEDLVFAFDADAAGLLAARRALDLALSFGFNVKLVTLPAGFKDPDEIIDHDPASWPRLIAGATPYLDFYFHQLFDILPLTDAHAKKQAVAQFLSLLAKLPDPIVVSHYLQLTAEAVGVKDQLLADLLNELKHRDRSSSDKGVKTPPAKIAVTPAERIEQRYIGLLLSEPESISEHIAALNTEHFQTPQFREIYRKLMELVASGRHAQITDFFEMYPDHRPAMDHAAFIMEVEGADTDLRRKELSEIAARMRMLALHRQRDRLSSLIVEAEKAGKAEEKNGLVLEYNTLLQKLTEEESKNDF